MMKLKNNARTYAPVCCGDMLSNSNTRREFMRLAGGAVLFSSIGMLSSGVQAASGNYEASVSSMEGKSSVETSLIVMNLSLSP